MGEEQERHAELVKAVVESNTPEPTPLVRAAQLVLAFLAMAGAIAIALILVLQGPPAPKEPTPDTKSSMEEKAPKTTKSTDQKASVEFAASTEEEPESTETETKTESEGESGGESEESLANLSKQGPWAFAIVALLVAAFIATGKSLGFSGTKPEGSNQTTQSGGSSK
jgi:hypothetical protein